MIKIKNFNSLRFLIILSVVFLLSTLYIAGPIKLPIVIHPLYLFFSFIILFIGTIIHSWSWGSVLKSYSIHISHYSTLASFGTTVFTKYIPGKVFQIFGKAEYVSKKYDLERSLITLISLKTQLIALLISFSLGIIGIIICGAKFDLIYWVTTGVIWIILFLSVLFFPKIIELKQKIKPSLNSYNFQSTSQPIAFSVFIIYWLLYCIAFQFFVMSFIDLSTNYINTFIGLGFAFGSSIGIISFFAPGGLGVRESALFFFFTTGIGLSIEDAKTISILSRFWFLSGEIFIFLYGLYARSKIRQLERTEN